MSRHFNTVHKGVKRFQCKNCGQKFTTKKNCESHEKKCEAAVDDDDEKC